MNKKIMNVIVVFMLITLCVLLIKPTYAANLDTDAASLKLTLINQDPDPAEPGKYVDVRLKVEKFGNNTLSNVTFNLETVYPFSFDGSDTADRNVGNIANISGQDWYYTLNYKLKVDSDAIEDTYTLKLRYKVNNSEITGIKEFDLKVADAKNPDFIIGSLISNPSKLVSDLDSAQLNIEISNIGDEDAQNVVAKINFPDGFIPTYSYSDRSNLGTIGSGTSKTATYYVDLDKSLVSKNYIVPILISYKEKDDAKNEYKTKILNIEIPIKEKPNFKVISIDSDPQVISPGDTVKLKINLKNIGKDADSVSLKIYKESSQPFTFNEKTDYIGNLEKDEEGNAIIILDVDKTAEIKKYILDLEIRSIDGDEVVVQTESITLNLEEKTKSNSFLFIGIGVVLLFIVGGYVYFKFIKKQNQQKKKK